MNIGKRIYRYCNGYFGRDDYADKIIIAEGYNWIVCVYPDHPGDQPTFASFYTEEEKQRYINFWSKEEEE